MDKFRIVTFLSRFLLLILLTSLINGRFSSVNMMQNTVSPVKNGESFAIVSAMNSGKTTAHEHQKHTGECHACCNCFCQVILPVQSITLVSNPVIMSFCSFSPVANLPEVILSRFIPPRTLA